MDTILFNAHDMLLLFTALECVIVAFLAGRVLRDQNRIAGLLLAAFLVCRGLICLHELTFWGAAVRHWLLAISPNCFFIADIAYFLDGPIFYYCVLFSLAPHPQKYGPVKLCIHALPALCYIGYLINSFYLLDINTKTALVRSQHIAYSAPYLYWDFCSRTLRLAYIAAAIVLCIRHGLIQYPAAKKLSVKKESLLTWLPSLVIAALVVLSGEWIIAAVKLIQFLQGDFDLDLLNILGLGNYYLAFLAINVVLLITAYPKRNTVQNHGASLHALLEHQTERGPSVLARVKEQRLYTQSDLTLQSLAQQLYISQRRLSQTIKEDLETNFSDFINTLRVELAQQYLSQKQKVTITEVLYSVGFNSKSVFNTVFRQKTGMTPSAFRKQTQQ